MMPSATDLAGLAGVACAISASVLQLPWAKRLAKHRLAILAGLVFVAALVPPGGLPLAAYVRGATGDLSITTMVLIWCALLRPWNGCETADSGSRLALLALIGLGAVMLYPMALGLGSFDPYRIGYGNGQFLAALLLVTLAAWFWKYYLITLCVALATLAWAIGWHESDNLWDYLLDPFVSIYALASIAIQAIKVMYFKIKGPVIRQVRDLKRP